MEEGREGRRQEYYSFLLFFVGIVKLSHHFASKCDRHRRHLHLVILLPQHPRRGTQQLEILKRRVPLPRIERKLRRMRQRGGPLLHAFRLRRLHRGHRRANIRLRRGHRRLRLGELGTGVEGGGFRGVVALGFLRRLLRRFFGAFLAGRFRPARELGASCRADVAGARNDFFQHAVHGFTGLGVGLARRDQHAVFGFAGTEVNFTRGDSGLI
mmetsp:Transcript_15041/g.38477  ORF Transcript_15041/g.38477 Transcript_15041/m.38477 type:complete len:212 (-) Transcript_15041:475-1110(-)